MLYVVVLAGNVSYAWPVSDFLPFFPSEFFLGQVFSSHPGTLANDFANSLFQFASYIAD